MLRRFFHSQFFAKLFYELLPATIASAIGAYLINSYFKPPAAPAQTEAATAANAQLMQLLRDQQALLTDYLKKSTEAHQRADQVVAQETDRIKAAERDAIAALREAKAAELRALVAAVARTSEASERRLAAKPTAAPAIVAVPLAPLPPPTERPASEPLQLHQAASAAPPPPMPAPAQTQAPAQAQAVPPPAATREAENGAIATLKSAVSAVERLPSRLLDWFSDAMPPRPPTDLPPRHFMKAAM